MIFARPSISATPHLCSSVYPAGGTEDDRSLRGGDRGSVAHPALLLPCVDQAHGRAGLRHHSSTDNGPLHGVGAVLCQAG